MPVAILGLRVFAVLASLTYRGVPGSVSVESQPPTSSDRAKLAEVGSKQHALPLTPS